MQGVEIINSYPDPSAKKEMGEKKQDIALKDCCSASS